MFDAALMHPEMASLVAAKASVPKTLDPQAARAGWNAYGDAQKKGYPAGMAARDTRLAGIGVRIYRPAGAAERPPVVFYIHGGCFIKGSLESGDVIAAGVCEATGCVVVSIDYRLAPEHPFPAAPEDCYAVVAHVAAHGDALGVDGTRLGIWGDSAGGNLAAAVCLMARDRGGPRLLAQALNYPCLSDDVTSGSYLAFGDDAPGLRGSYMDYGWAQYLSAGRPATEGYAAPLKAASLAGLPPAHVHIAEFDVLADEGRAYASRIQAEGGEAVLAVAERMIHGFLRARFAGPASAAEFLRPCGFLRRHLGPAAAAAA
jgi:acetyl esterase